MHFINKSQIFQSLIFQFYMQNANAKKHFKPIFFLNTYLKYLYKIFIFLHNHLTISRKMTEITFIETLIQ